jgi:hypothetical protein
MTVVLIGLILHERDRPKPLRDGGGCPSDLQIKAG